MTSTVPSAAADAPTFAADLTALVDEVRSLTLSGRRHVLGIAGTPGAGKSTISDALLEALGDQAVLVGMDAFHLSNRQLERLGRTHRKGAPDTFDVAGYRSMLERVRDHRETVYAPVFDRSIEESIAAAVVIPVDVPIVITEGNYLLLESDGWAEIRHLLDTAWFVDVDPDERRRRLVARRRSHGHPADEASAWVHDVDEPNAVLVEGTRVRADLVVHLPPSAAGITPASNPKGARA